MLFRFVEIAIRHTRNNDEFGPDFLDDWQAFETVFELKHCVFVREEFIEIHRLKSILSRNRDALNEPLLGQVVWRRVVQVRERHVAIRQTGFDEQRRFLPVHVFLFVFGAEVNLRKIKIVPQNMRQRLRELEREFRETLLDFKPPVWRLHVVAERIPLDGDLRRRHRIPVIQFIVEVVNIEKLGLDVAVRQLPNAFSFWNNLRFEIRAPGFVLVKRTDVVGSRIIQFEHAFVDRKRRTTNLANIIGIRNPDPRTRKFADAATETQTVFESAVLDSIRGVAINSVFS